MSNKCGEPNFANFGDCLVCGRTYEQIREMSALTFLEATTTSNETYAERPRRRETFIAGMETGQVFLPLGDCRRLPPAMEITIKSQQMATIQTQCREHCQFNELDSTSTEPTEPYRITELVIQNLLLVLLVS